MVVLFLSVMPASRIESGASKDRDGCLGHRDKCGRYTARFAFTEDCELPTGMHACQFAREPVGRLEPFTRPGIELSGLSFFLGHQPLAGERRQAAVPARAQLFRGPQFLNFLLNQQASAGARVVSRSAISGSFAST